MKQVIFSGPSKLEVANVPRPVPKRGEALVEVRVCGICTWEQRVYRGTRKDYPLLGGHEISGVVQEANECASLRMGDKVAVSRVPRCGACIYCKVGQDNLCSYFTAVRTPGELWGPAG